MEKLNTKLTFYWTVLQDREFKKVVFQTVLFGHPFETVYDAQEWESEHTSEIFSEHDFEIVFDHVILHYMPTDNNVQDVYMLDEISGNLSFKSKVKKTKKKKDGTDLEETILKETIKGLEKQLEEIESSDLLRYELINSELNDLKIANLKLEIENSNLKIQLIEATKSKEPEIIKRRDYQSIWLDRSGKIYSVDFAGHEKFAREYLDEHDVLLDSGDYAYEVLQEKGWIRVLGWTDPPTFVLPEQQITPKQKTSLREYCQSQNVTYTAMPEILKE